MMGLPGCGKSTQARKMMNDEPNKWVRVNKDEIRESLKKEGWTWSQENEKKVIAIRDSMIMDALKNGKCVISDDTNLAKVHRLRLGEIAKECGAKIKMEFINTPVDECIRRDSFRVGSEQVGAEVIHKMSRQYHLYSGSVVEKVITPEVDVNVDLTLPVAKSMTPTTPSAPDVNDHLFKKVEVNGNLMDAIICDLDGTLALFEGLRGPYESEKCESDLINPPIKKIISLFSKNNTQIIYVSGREDKHKSLTQKWLSMNYCPLGPLHMRKSGDVRKDWIVKGEIFDQFIRDKYNVLFVLDDRPSVLRFWQSIGLTTLAVGPLKEF